MDYSLFKALIEIAHKEYNRIQEMNKNLTLAFGGNSSVKLDTVIIDSILNLIIEQFPKSAPTMYWFFYDVLVPGKYDETFQIQGKEYFANTAGIYKLFTSTLE